MALYSALVPVVEAHQWFKNGDHPEDRTINRINTGRIVQRHPAKGDPEDTNTICSKCGQVMGTHGLLNPQVHLNQLSVNADVCPGDYIQTHRREDGRVIGYTVYNKQLFEFQYGPYKEPTE